MNWLAALLALTACVNAPVEQGCEPEATPTTTQNQPSPKPTKTPEQTPTPNPLTIIIFEPEKPIIDKLFFVKICGYQSFELISLWDKEIKLGKMAFDRQAKCHKMSLILEKDTVYSFSVKRGEQILAERELR